MRAWKKNYHATPQVGEPGKAVDLTVKSINRSLLFTTCSAVIWPEQAAAVECLREGPIDSNVVFQAVSRG